MVTVHDFSPRTIHTIEYDSSLRPHPRIQLPHLRKHESNSHESAPTPPQVLLNTTPCRISVTLVNKRVRMQPEKTRRRVSGPNGDYLGPGTVLRVVIWISDLRTHFPVHWRTDNARGQPWRESIIPCDLVQQ